LSKLESFLHGSQVLLPQKPSIETFACENGTGGELHVVEGGVRVEKSLEGVVVVDRSAIESSPSKSRPTQEYLRFTQFVE